MDGWMDGFVEASFFTTNMKRAIFTGPAFHVLNALEVSTSWKVNMQYI